MEKQFSQGIIQHFITTTQRMNHDLSENRLEESYDQATATASILVYQLKVRNKPVILNDAYTDAQAHLDKTDKALRSHLKR
jgi:hypothetical protein